ncbi:hypothetical protein H0274_09770 [Altererythrobacter sp. CC-YST694]|uniref:hypothetical protein n=1 Tax=Altererythrobacter sp. CC-YST694 TaxID=2755038 RepID=UPI001D010A09|nr:hypothetical protein [Altererythrobacter sp. CC-YST694]MCB5425545.1 hypothetical protein [Altererythrobacter sp. CC-YST694]
MHYDPAMRHSAPFATLLRAALAVSPALLLAACGPNDTDPGPGGVTVAEARALDEAAEMIEQRRLPDAALEEGAQAPAATQTPAHQEAPSPGGSGAD